MANYKNKWVLFFLMTSLQLVLLFVKNALYLWDAQLNQQKNTWLGGDLVLNSPDPWQEKILNYLRQNNFNYSQAVIYPGTVLNQDKFSLVEVKAVDSNYPLMGELILENIKKSERTQKIPKSGEVWIEPRLAQQLNLKLGDTLEFGASEFKVGAFIEKEPDRSWQGVIFAPRFLINISDLESTKTVLSGSRVNYRLALADPEQKFSKIEQAFRNLLNPDVRLIRASDNEELPEFAKNTELLIKILIFLNCSLLGAAIYALLKYMGEQQGYALAIYRCLGASRKQMAVVLLHVFMKPSLLAFVFSNGLIYSLPLPLELNLEILLMNFGFGVLMWFILVFILVLPTLWPLLSVAPYGLLKQQEGLRISNIQARRLFLVPISSLLVLSYWLEKSNLKLIYISSGLLFGFIILGIFLETGFKLLNTWLQDKAESINFIAQRILARGQELSIQILLLTLVLTGIQTTHILAKNFSSQYTDLSKKNTPNYFLMNIEPHEKLKFESMLKIENNKYFSQIYPTVRARLLKINNSPIGYGDVSEKMNLNRLLNITWSENIPKDNNLMQGAWWEKNSIASKNIENLVSVEEKFAERMGIKIGDKITMQEGAFIWESEVFNLRQVTWENFQPNFFLIFKPSINLEFLPKTYMLSSYIPDSERKFLLDLIAKFPSMSILDFNFSIKEMKGILNQVQNFVQVNFGFMLISGFVLFWIFLKNGFPERKKEFEILRVLGASLDSLKQQLWVEWLLMAFCIALGSGLLINLICTYVSKTFLKMSYVWNWDLFGLNFLFLGFFMFLQLNFSNNKLIK